MAFDIAPYGAAIEAVSNLGSSVLKRLFPEKMSEVEAASFKQAITMELLKNDQANIFKEFEDRASARVLAAADVDKGNWFTNVLAATVRPLFGYIVMAAFVASWVPALIPGGQNFVTITEIQKEIMLTTIYFFFGGRTVEKGLQVWASTKTAK